MRKLLLVAMLAATSAAAQKPDPPEWQAPHKPFRIYGNTYYVGSEGLSSILITSPQGHVLIDGTLAENAPMIMDHIKQLGFRVQDVKLILNSHVHYDHAAGTAALQRASGATVAATEWSANVLKSGKPGKDDPQFVLQHDQTPVANVRVVRDGEELKVGPIIMTAHLTPGHTPGSTSWTWKSCDGNRCLDMVYADSQTPVSADGFFFTKSGGVQQFERGFAVLDKLRCDVLITPHPGASSLFERVEKNAVVDPEACRRLVATGREALAKRVKAETEKP